MKSLMTGAVLGAIATSLVAFSTPAPAQGGNGKAAVLIFDASGSMWGQLPGGLTKIEVARDVMGQFFATRDAAIPLGVIAYGHNRRGDCADIEVIASTGVQDAAALSQRLNRINPRGMTPISQSLRVAAGQIPPTAEEADIILVTDGLETCDADPCAVAARLANEGIRIRAHVVGFGLTEQEAQALACVPDQTGGQLLRPQSGAELTAALNQIAAAEPTPAPVQEAFFDIGPKAEAGHTYRIAYKGTAQNSDFAGFTPRGEGKPPSSASFGPIGGGTPANNPFSKRAPSEPGLYDLILFKNNGEGIVARQPIEVVAASNGFDPIGSVEPGSRMQVAFRGPEQVGERLVLARPDQPVGDFRSYSWTFSLHKNGVFQVRAPDEPGEYEVRYLNSAANEIMFSRRFGVGIAYQDADLTTSDDLAAQAAAATRAEPGQDDLPMVRATFRIPPGFSETPLWWSAVPLDPDMSPEAWAPQSEMWVGEGTFEPGRYEVSTMGPGETEFRGVVEIVPGQANDFVIPLVGGGEAEQNPPGQRGDAGPLDPMSKMVTLILPPEVEGRQVQWSAIRLDRGMQDVEFAMNDPMGDLTTAFADGRYEITGAGAGFTLKGEITVEPGGRTSFVIPVSTAQRAEESQGMDCQAARPCSYHDPVTGLALTLPSGWRVTPPYYSATATGATASYPSAAISQPVGGIFQHIMLNPSDWNPAYGPCVEVPVGRLCRSEMGDIAYHRDFETIRSSLALRAATFLVDDFGDDVDPIIDVAVLCRGPAHCDYFDPDTGLRMVVPAGWAMSEAFFVSATAGAIPQENPRISFFRIGGSDSERFEFNPHQWLNSNGPCEATLIGAVCHFLDAPESTRIAMMTAGLHARIDKDAAANGGDAFEHRAGTNIDPRGPYAAGQKTLFVVRRDESLETDEIAVFPARGPLSGATVLSRHRDLGSGYYGSVTMPMEPGTYRVALLREGERIVQGVEEIVVEADPEMRFTDWNAQPFPGRPLSVNLHGRMAYDDAIAILAPDGRELARASVFEAMTGRLRTPEGLSGAHRLVHIARGPAGERPMASVALDVGARANTVEAGGSGGDPVISVAPRVLAGSKVAVSVRGAIPEKPILGFIRPSAKENQILETSQRFLPPMPSTSVNAPRQTGQWMMRLADHNLWRFAEVPVEVVDRLDEAEPEAAAGRDIKPRDGTWTAVIGNTALDGCPAAIADQIRSAGLQGRSNSRNIDFADPFHPDPLMADSPMPVAWTKTGPGAWRANLAAQSMGAMGNVEARYELTVVSDTEMREVSHFSLQLPAEVMAALGGSGGSDRCTARTSVTWNWQG